ncbi:MAG: hypothetical protein DBX59_10595 [Bacillota bacterium]|nr:MAG: hypothetical protein DBX59_10595 [Bacillota bacterium]
MKKLLFPLLCSLMILTSACAPLSTDGATNIWTETNAVKVLRSVTSGKNKKVTVSAAKGEYEGAQILINSSEKIENIEIALNDLTCGTHKIAKTNVAVYRQHYFDLQTAYDSSQKKDRYPDALVPFDASAKAGENRADANETFAIWLTFKIPETAESGAYTAEFQLILDGKRHSVPVELTVYDFALPKENHVRTAFALWIDDLCDIWGNANPDVHKVANNAEVKTLLQNYTNMLAEYRISTTALPLLWNELEDPKAVAKAAKEATLNPKIASYSVPVKEIEAEDGISEYKFKETLLELIRQSTNDIDLLKKAYLYIPKIDEPLSQNTIPLAIRVNKIVEKVRAELLADASLWTGKQQVKESLSAMQHVLTADYDPRLEGAAQTWCPYFSSFDTEEQRNVYYERRNAYGEGIWWYGCVGPKYPYPTFHMNNNIASARTIGWMQKVYDIEGQLYWTVNLSKQMREDDQYHIRDIWNDAYSFYDIAGDGYLVYAGAKYGIDNALPSIRLEAVRDGFEDYEYLWLLEETLSSLNEKYKTAYSLAEYVQHLSDKLFDGTKPTVIDENVTLAKNELSDLILAAKYGILILNENNSLCIYAPENIVSLKINGNSASRDQANKNRFHADAVENNTLEFINSEEKTFIIRYSL